MRVRGEVEWGPQRRSIGRVWPEPAQQPAGQTIGEPDGGEAVSWVRVVDEFAYKGAGAISLLRDAAAANRINPGSTKVAALTARSAPAS